MNFDAILLVVLGLCLTGTYFFARTLLKADNSFFYRNGRAMRGWDILFAIDRKKFDRRLQDLSIETIPFFRKWIFYDIRFAPVFHIAVAILLYFAKKAYAQPGFQLFFDVLIVSQGLSLISHIITDIMLMSSLKHLEMQDSMALFNFNVIIKMLFPMIGCFVSFATLVLVWFRFLDAHGLAMATLLFMVPPVLIIVIVKLAKAIKPKVVLSK